jgi:hypothetical protein
MSAPTSLDDFQHRFIEIKKKGWIKTHRAGDTGIGKTLEDLLEITENNNNSPDFGNVYELKAMRTNSNCKLTLFASNPLPRGSNSKLRDNYGYRRSEIPSIKNILNINLSVTSMTKIADTGLSLGLKLENDRLNIINNNHEVLAYWPESRLEKAFKNKYKKTLVHVYADSRSIGREEEFLFHTTKILSGFTFQGFSDLLREGVIEVEPRIGVRPDMRPHDRGTAFRIQERYLDQLFSSIDVLVE